MPYRLIPRRLRERVGRRGLVLLLFGIAWLVTGVAYFELRDLIEAQPRYFFVDKLPLALQGSLWIVSGALSVAASLRPRRENDTFGFLAVTTMPLLLGASYLVGTVTYALDGSQLWVLGALSFLVWAPIILALGVIASWHEPPIIRGTDD